MVRAATTRASVAAGVAAGIARGPSVQAAPPMGSGLAACAVLAAAHAIPARGGQAAGASERIGRKTNTKRRHEIPVELRAKTSTRMPRRAIGAELAENLIGASGGQAA